MKGFTFDCFNLKVGIFEFQKKFRISADFLPELCIKIDLWPALQKEPPWSGRRNLRNVTGIVEKLMWICIGFNGDPDLAFYLNADSDPGS
jgi:hypothetical protein